MLLKVKLNTIKQTNKPILMQFFAAKCKSWWVIDGW